MARRALWLGLRLQHVGGALRRAHGHDQPHAPVLARRRQRAIVGQRHYEWSSFVRAGAVWAGILRGGRLAVVAVQRVLRLPHAHGLRQVPQLIVRTADILVHLLVQQACQIRVAVVVAQWRNGGERVAVLKELLVVVDGGRRLARFIAIWESSHVLELGYQVVLNLVVGHSAKAGG